MEPRCGGFVADGQRRQLQQRLDADQCAGAAVGQLHWLALATGDSLNFDGTSSFDYVHQDTTFGSSIGFTLTFPDTAPAQTDPTADSAFFVSVLDARTSRRPSRSRQPATSNQALAFTLQASSAPTLESFTSLATVVSAVPEPGTAPMLACLAGLAGLNTLRRRSAGAVKK